MYQTITNIFAMAPAGGADQSGSGMWMTLIMFAAIILIMYFLMIRPQQKRQKEHKQMLDNLKKGDKVIMASGIHGTIKDIDGPTVTIEIAENTNIQIEKNAIAAKK
ncbi:MAG: preprotein translocase subunit YajC [Candidatus Woesearchaeota archaeon]